MDVRAGAYLGPQVCRIFLRVGVEHITIRNRVPDPRQTLRKIFPFFYRMSDEGGENNTIKGKSVIG